jgi:hypothetical protein
MLLDNGITRMTFSAGDLGEEYEEVYGLEFENTLANIKRFTEMNRDDYDGQCDIWISLVEHEINYGHRDEIKEFWTDIGVNGVYSYRQISRGGACDHGFFFLGSDRFIDESLAVMDEYGISSLCNLAFTAPFVGWSGQYYICCSDYEKKEPLGSVFDYSIEQMDRIKMQSICAGNEACLNCNYDPLNSIRENFFEKEKGIIDDRSFRQRLVIMQKDQQSQEDIYGENGVVSEFRQIKTARAEEL